MRIPFLEIAEPTRYEDKLGGMALPLGYHYEAKLAPVDLELIASPLERGCRISGKFHYRVTLPCSRCLEPVEISGDADFSLNVYPQSLAPSDEDLEVPLEEPVDVFVKEDYVDSKDLVSQQMYLEIPEKALCSEDCKGLCPSCGADLNHAPCDCRIAADSRWAALESLTLTKKE
ncbi:MAG: DUF177 domain-containing protein [Acidobacteriota bacterium]|jgi:uncharacterized protein